MSWGGTNSLVLSSPHAAKITAHAISTRLRRRGVWNARDRGWFMMIPSGVVAHVEALFEKVCLLTSASTRVLWRLQMCTTFAPTAHFMFMDVILWK